jgi:hypothetical protein
MRKGKDPDPYLWLMDPDPEGLDFLDPQHYRRDIYIVIANTVRSNSQYYTVVDAYTGNCIFWGLCKEPPEDKDFI